MNKSNPGCLTVILRLFGSKPKSSSAGRVIDDKDDAFSFPYRLRDDFLSPAEQSFFLVLKSIIGEQFTICPKVSLSDIFFVVRPNENMSAYNRINRKHVDFLICDPKTMIPRFAIELDDSSHRRSDREERDEFVDGVFNAANLPIVHIPVRNSYNTLELDVLFKQTLQQNSEIENELFRKEKTSLPTDSLTESEKQIPNCPKCGVPMILRTAKTSQRAGQQFYGCRNFPKCREVAPYNP